MGRCGAGWGRMWWCGGGSEGRRRRRTAERGRVGGGLPGYGGAGVGRRRLDGRRRAPSKAPRWAASRCERGSLFCCNEVCGHSSLASRALCLVGRCSGEAERDWLAMPRGRRGRRAAGSDGFAVGGAQTEGPTRALEFEAGESCTAVGADWRTRTGTQLGPGGSRLGPSRRSRPGAYGPPRPLPARPSRGWRREGAACLTPRTWANHLPDTDREVAFSMTLTHNQKLPPEEHFWAG